MEQQYADHHTTDAGLSSSGPPHRISEGFIFAQNSGNGWDADDWRAEWLSGRAKSGWFFTGTGLGYCYGASTPKILCASHDFSLLPPLP